MTTEPVKKLVLSLAGPSIVIMLTSAIYSITDTYFVSFLGTSQIGAVGIAFPLKAIVQAKKSGVKKRGCFFLFIR